MTKSALRFGRGLMQQHELEYSRSVEVHVDEDHLRLLLRFFGKQPGDGGFSIIREGPRASPWVHLYALRDVQWVKEQFGKRVIPQWSEEEGGFVVDFRDVEQQTIPVRQRRKA